MSKSVRQKVFDAASRMARRDLEGFERAVVLVHKKKLKKAIEEIEQERKTP